jgi:hypothetical protein
MLSEGRVEVLHHGAIVELTLVDCFANGEGDPLVHDRKVADRALCSDRPFDDLI